MVKNYTKIVSIALDPNIFQYTIKTAHNIQLITCKRGYYSRQHQWIFFMNENKFEKISYKLMVMAKMDENITI